MTRDMDGIIFKYRTALEDMREREGRLQVRNARWLFLFHQRFGGPVQ